MSFLDPRDNSDSAEVDQLGSIAENVFGLQFDASAKFGAESNMIGFHTPDLICSRRLDSLTYFVQNYRHGLGRAEGVFKGDNQTQFEFCRQILHKLDIPLSEIGKEAVLREKTQIARVDNLTTKAEFEPVQEGGNFARIMRQIRGLPVWSSNLLLGLTEQKRIGFLQLHWPAIPVLVETEARRLSHKLAEGWNPPEQEDAIIESMEAGIVHTPPAGSFLDIHAAIRVIYAPINKRMGRKVMLYLNRHGKNVDMRRRCETPVQAQEMRKR